MDKYIVKNPNLKANQVKSDNRIKKFDFGQLREALIGYVASMDMRINNIMDDDDLGGVPVFCQGLDVGYLMHKKYSMTENADLNMRIPRVAIKFDDIAGSNDMNGSQDVRIRYIFNNKTYEALFRKKTKIMTVSNHFIASNYIRATEYYGIIESIMRRTYPYTYEFLGNTHQGAYELTNATITHPDMGMGSISKDFIVTFMCELQVQLWAINYDSIREIDVFKGVNEGDGFEGENGNTEKGSNRIKWIINSKTKDTDYKTEMKTPHNPDCIGCSDCMDFGI